MSAVTWSKSAIETLELRVKWQNMAKILQVSHILQTYFTSEIKAQYEKHFYENFWIL